tara:strand:- start:3495 stop:4037 length:543 start_codon:yes stop_codon:yes gene_type:complete
MFIPVGHSGQLRHPDTRAAWVMEDQTVPKYHLAELNIGRLRAPKDDPRVADFINNLDRINGLGKRMPGFIWMMEGEAGQGNTATAINGDPQFIPNLTVWENSDTLETFVFNTLHAKFMNRRAEWFTVLDQMHFAMWWVPAGHKPTLQEALLRLETLRRDGDTAQAFGWDYLRANPAPPVA